MGSSLAPILVERAIEEAINYALEKSKVNIIFWKKYVNDNLTAIEEEKAELLLQSLDQYNSNIQFTMEKEENGSIVFLDTTIHRQNEWLITKWYAEPMASGRLINFHSAHPKHMIMNTAKSFIRRVLFLSDKQFFDDNIHTIKDILTRNSFPTDIIEQLIFTVTKTN